LKQLPRDAEALDHDFGDVVGRVADPLDVLHDLEDAGHLLGVGAAAGGENGGGTHVVGEVVEALFEAEDLF
jgi:hypothetical protein